ncbi:MAG TPA: hypothetical protein VK426_00015 [Methanobacterium sp.]|nr:hypothetical protein [Methanobacterium sp.]
MKSRNIWFISFFILVFIVSSSGCIIPLPTHTNINITNEKIIFNNTINSSSASQDISKTFYNEGISFNYPTDWVQIPTWLDKILSNDDYEIGFFIPPIKNGGVVIDHYYLSDFGSSSIEEDFKSTVEDMKNQNATIIKENKTIINNLTVYEVINTNYDTYYDDNEKILYVETGKNQNAYIIQFYGEPNDFDEYLPLFEQVVSTIKIK